MREPILVINAGSSSIKFSVFETTADRSLSAGAHGQVEGIGTAPHLEVTDPKGNKLADGPVAGEGHAGAIAAIHDWFGAHVGGEAGFDGVGHRVVHGGATYSQPVLIDSQVMAVLESLIPLAPLHEPHHIGVIRAMSAIAPKMPQVACFDTAFHRSQPALAQEFALPRELTAKGIRRYGFHGLSYEYIVSALPEVMPDCAKGKVVVAHLGNGASMCAIDGGRSVAATMGFTAVDGLPMGTRTGALDPGVILYLLQHERMDTDGIEKLIYRVRASSGSRAFRAICGPCWRAMRRRQKRPSTSSSTASDASSDHLLPRSAGSTHSSSLPGGALARHHLGREGQCQRRPTHLEPRLRRVGLGDPDRREPDDRAACAPLARRRGTAMSFHIPETQSQVLAGKVGLVTGIANDQSIAHGCARALRDVGASLAITYLNEKARPYVEPLAGALEAELFLPLDVREAPQMTAVFAAIREKWGRLDFLIHSLAFAPKADLQGRLVDSSVEGFLTAMDISCHSFVRMANFAEPLMTDGGALVTMSYYGADKVIANYSLMGPVKAALEAAVRYLACELGPKRIRVHAVSPGPLKTRAASGLAHFDELLAEAELRAPERDLVDILDIGAATAFLCSPFAKLITGGTIYVDGGYNIRG